MRQAGITLLVGLVSLAGAQPQRLPSVPRLPATQAASPLRVCLVGDTTLLLDRLGQVRALRYGQRYPDNSLSVQQSYDRVGKLTGIQVQWSGFAGLLLNLRGAFDAQGRLIRKSGDRGVDNETLLRRYIRPVPSTVKCKSP
ncbi:hypothetical protein [Deinococcus apachensis]|uniref:hypothetical protein n=1 Tax=Deinococcus apachensis TaxID=309886 RepID=UPI00036EF18E|nr:hypothetical protein [Deinococcus apachensis]